MSSLFLVIVKGTDSEGPTMVEIMGDNLFHSGTGRRY